jgi:hypothetical protein
MQHCKLNPHGIYPDLCMHPISDCVPNPALALRCAAFASVHLPFCKRKCFYCDFPVEAVGLNTDKPSE